MDQQKYQKCLIFHQLSTTLHPDCYSAHLETVLSWVSMACQLQFPSCPTLLTFCCGKLSVLSWLSTKIPPPDINITDLTWSLPIKSGSLPVFSRRVGNISAGQARNTYRQAVNRNQQACYKLQLLFCSNRTLSLLGYTTFTD